MAPRNGLLTKLAEALVAHWLTAFNGLNGLILAGTFASPVLAALGAPKPAQLIFAPYRALCLQRPDHSFFIFGHQMAMEQRMVAIYGAFFLVGLIYAYLRHNWYRALPLWAYALLSLPMAADVLTQMAGLRVSDWTWRTATGALFGAATVVFLYPRLDRAFEDVLAVKRTAPPSSVRILRG